MVVDWSVFIQIFVFLCSWILNFNLYLRPWFCTELDTKPRVRGQVKPPHCASTMQRVARHCPSQFERSSVDTHKHACTHAHTHTHWYQIRWKNLSDQRFVSWKIGGSWCVNKQKNLILLKYSGTPLKGKQIWSWKRWSLVMGSSTWNFEGKCSRKKRRS